MNQSDMTLDHQITIYEKETNEFYEQNYI